MNKIVLTADTTAIIIPALNEALSIRNVITDALAYCPHVIVVDDGSDDGTANCISDLPIILIRHPQRRGKGAALRSGFAAATQLGVQGVITMDGDGQHSAADFPRLLAAANYHPGCVIIGARLRKRSEQPWIRRIGNHFGDWGLAGVAAVALSTLKAGSASIQPLYLPCPMYPEKTSYSRRNC